MQLLGAAVIAGIMGVTVALDNNTYQLLSSALQIFTIIYLNRVDSRQRHVIAPKLDRVQDIAAALDPRVAGGRRQHDPDPSDTTHHDIP